MRRSCGPTPTGPSSPGSRWTRWWSAPAAPTPPTPRATTTATTASTWNGTGSAATPRRWRPGWTSGCAGPPPTRSTWRSWGPSAGPSSPPPRPFRGRSTTGTTADGRLVEIRDAGGGRGAGPGRQAGLLRRHRPAQHRRGPGPADRRPRDRAGLRVGGVRGPAGPAAPVHRRPLPGHRGHRRHEHGRAVQLLPPGRAGRRRLPRLRPAQGAAARVRWRLRDRHQRPRGVRADAPVGPLVRGADRLPDQPRQPRRGRPAGRPGLAGPGPVGGRHRPGPLPLRRRHRRDGPGRRPSRGGRGRRPRRHRLGPQGGRRPGDHPRPQRRGAAPDPRGARPRGRVREVSHVFARGTGLPTVARARGCEIWDTEGRRYLDGAGGAIVVGIGHGDASVAAAIAEQAERVAYAHGTMFASEQLEAYADELAPLLPLDDPRVYPVSGGSEAVETALKMARAYHLARGEDRWRVIGRQGSYHGNTRGALDVGGREPLRRPYLPWLGQASHTLAPYAYRCRFGDTHPAGCGARYADALEQEILASPAGTVAAFVAEPVAGAGLGAAVPSDDYWPAVTEVCRRHGVLLIADEVMTGFGRTGRFLACDHWAVRPDIMVLAKGAASGYWPLGLAVASGEVHDTIAAAGGFTHGLTYSHHVVGAAAGRAVLRVLRERRLVEAAEV